MATRQGLTVRVETDPDVPMMEIDRGLLRQAIHNLVKNGMEVLSSGGEITIASRCRGETVEISVADTGGGIAEDVGAGSSSPSSRPSPRAPVSASPSPARSSRSTAASSAGPTARRGATFTIALPVKRAAHV